MALFQSQRGWFVMLVWTCVPVTEHNAQLAELPDYPEPHFRPTRAVAKSAAIITFLFTDRVADLITQGNNTTEACTSPNRSLQMKTMATQGTEILYVLQSFCVTCTPDSPAGCRLNLTACTAHTAHTAVNLTHRCGAFKQQNPWLLNANRIELKKQVHEMKET